MRTSSVRHQIRPIRMRYLWSDFSAWKEPFSVGVYGEVFALFQACVGNFDIACEQALCPGKKIARKGLFTG